MRIDRQRFTLYREFLGLPWRIRRGDTKTLVIEEQRDAHGEATTAISDARVFC